MRNRCDRDDHRGSAAHRRALYVWLLSPESGWGGDGQTVPCWECGVLCGPDDVDLIRDRIIPGERGGSYRRDNIAPHCGLCSHRQGNRRAHALAAERRAKTRSSNPLVRQGITA